jgi:hypothetical protein
MAQLDVDAQGNRFTSNPSAVSPFPSPTLRWTDLRAWLDSAQAVKERWSHVQHRRRMHQLHCIAVPGAQTKLRPSAEPRFGHLTLPPSALPRTLEVSVQIVFYNPLCSTLFLPSPTPATDSAQIRPRPFRL